MNSSSVLTFLEFELPQIFKAIFWKDNSVLPPEDTFSDYVLQIRLKWEKKHPKGSSVQMKCLFSRGGLAAPSFGGSLSLNQCWSMEGSWLACHAGWGCLAEKVTASVSGKLPQRRHTGTSPRSQPVPPRREHQGLRCAVKELDEVTTCDSVCQIIFCHLCEKIQEIKLPYYPFSQKKFLTIFSRGEVFSFLVFSNNILM